MLRQSNFFFRGFRIIKPERSTFIQSRWLCTESDSEQKKPKRRVKRRVAMVAAYAGTGYYGLQHNAASQLPTIEYDICEALHKVGCISQDNLHDIKKIGWSRTSRTDKGVHASSVVTSAKLLIDPDTIDPITGHIESLPAEINEHLPPTVRIMSCVHVNKGFRAHATCTLREYEYFLPVDFFKQCISRMSNTTELTEEQVQERIESFKKLVQEYEGSHDFHNFTRKTNQRFKRDKHWHVDKARTIAMKQFTMRHIYSSKCDDGIFMLGGVPMIRFEVKAQGFMLHQIRCMLGAAITVACGAVPMDYFLAALHTDMKLYIPLAPPVGLVLKNCAFSGKGTRHHLRLEQDRVEEVKQKDAVSTDRPHANEQRVFIYPAQDEKLVNFRNEVIYPALKKAWENKEEATEWIEKTAEKMEYTEYPPDLFSAALQKRNDENEKHELRKHSMLVKRRQEAVSTGIVSDFKDLIPRFFAGRLSIEYGLIPGASTANVQRALVHLMLNGELPLEIKMNELLDYVRTRGFTTLRDLGLQVHIDEIEAEKELRLQRALEKKQNATQKKDQEPLEDKME